MRFRRHKRYRSVYLTDITIENGARRLILSSSVGGRTANVESFHRAALDNMYEMRNIQAFIRDNNIQEYRFHASSRYTESFIGRLYNPEESYPLEDMPDAPTAPVKSKVVGKPAKSLNQLIFKH